MQGNLVYASLYKQKKNCTCTTTGKPSCGETSTKARAPCLTSDPEVFTGCARRSHGAGRTARADRRTNILRKALWLSAREIKKREPVCCTSQKKETKLKIKPRTRLQGFQPVASSTTTNKGI